jgi:hypothetical protein
MPQLERAEKGFAIQAVDEISQRFLARLVMPRSGRDCRAALLFVRHRVPLFFWRTIIATVGNGHNRTTARSCYGTVTSTRRSLIAQSLSCFALAPQFRSIEGKSLVAHARVGEAYG